MKFKKKLIVVLIVNFLFSYQGLRAFNQQEKKDEKYWQNYWQNMLKKYPVSENAIELEKKFSFPSEELEKKGYYLARPRYIGHDSLGNIFVTDIKANKIMKFDSSGNFLLTFGQAGQGPGDLSRPYEFFVTKDDILIVGELGNKRFQFLDTEGKYLKSFKIFKGYLSWAMNDEGLIFAVASLTLVKNPEKAHLIEVLSQEGEVLYSFGKPINFKYQPHLYNRANLAINKKGEVLVAFLCLPIVRKYSQKGKLLAEYRIDHKLMKKFEKNNLQNQSLLAQGKKVTYYPIIYSIKACEDEFYIFRCYPRVEILEFDNNGKLRAWYWYTPQRRNYRPNQFLVQNVENQKMFYMINDNEARIDVFIQKQ